MALAHNGMIRGLNSIHTQAPNIPSTDTKTIKDFLIYCQCWCESMHHHHDMEEENFFPAIEKLTGVEGLMASNVEQHRAFTPGFEVFHTYVQTCEPKDYDGVKLRSLVEGFAEPLTTHLSDEINTLRELHEYDSERVRSAYKDFEKLLMNTDNVRSRIRLIHTPANAMFGSNALHRLYSAPRTEGLKGAYMISRPCRSSYRISFITCLRGSTVGHGDSIRVRSGEIDGIWLFLTKMCKIDLCCIIQKYYLCSVIFRLIR